MTLERFRTLANSYGAELRRWPAEERGQAETLLRSSEAARAILNGARTGDDLLGIAPAGNEPAASPADETAVERLRVGIWARIEASATRSSEAPTRAFARWLSWPQFRWATLAVASVIAIAAGIWIGKYHESEQPASDIVVTLLQPGPLPWLTN
jgi:hypothetical protein